jgi:hypothetical protein
MEMTNTNHIVSSGYTMGFWIFSTTKDLSTNLFKVVYEDNFMMTISTDTDLYGYCFTGLEYIDLDTYLASKTELNTLLAGTDKDTINYLKTDKIVEQKWNYVRCGYSYANKKIYNDVNYVDFASGRLKTADLKDAPYFKGANVFPPPRKMRVSQPKLKVTRLTGLTGVTVFIRNLVLFADYIPPQVHFQYM